MGGDQRGWERGRGWCCGVGGVAVQAVGGKANAAAETLAGIERDRRRSELTPRFRIAWEPANPGVDALTMRIMLTGPPGLDRVDRLTVRIRNDHFRRDDWPLTAGGPTREQVQQQIWGPYRFRPHTGPDDARADEHGRVTVYDHEVPVGEQLQFLLEPTVPPSWSRDASGEWWRGMVGTVIRLALEAERTGHGRWTLPAELDTAPLSRPGVITVP